VKTLEQLAIEHPYYCEHENYFDSSGDWYTTFHGWDEFKKNMLESDNDLNFLFRFDLEKIEHTEVYILHLYFILQRKGIYMSQQVNNITKYEEVEVSDYLEKKAAYLRQVWTPFFTEG